MPKSFKCGHCGELIHNEEELDEYDLLNRHLDNCKSEIAKKIRRMKEEEDRYG